MPDRLEAIAEVVERRAEGIRLTSEEIANIKGERQPNGVLSLFSVDGLQPMTAEAAQGQPPAPNASVIAVISVFGIIAQHAAQVDDISGPGGTSTERVTRSFRSAINDPSVKAIVLHIDSPGGNVHGVQALFDEIISARGNKPIVAQVNSLAASAAYWIACACDEIVVTPGGQVGSIGVYGLHRDVSKAADAMGVKFTFISAGKYKVEGNQYEPLSDEAHQALQEQIDAYYADFTGGVAQGRGVKQADVVNGFGEGRVEKDKKAVKLGMADRVATMDDTLQRLAKMKRPSGTKALAVAEMQRPIEADSLMVHRSAEGVTTLDSNIPSTVIVSTSVFDGDDDLPIDGLASLDAEALQMTFSAANGAVVYEIIGMDSVARVLIGRLLTATIETMPSAEQQQATADRDAYRRRRHAHRMRNA
jgi:signal peptide peptidase SppA